MKRKKDLSDAVSRLLRTEPLPADFPSACRLLRVTPGVLDEWIRAELGISGEELFLILGAV